MSTPLPPPIPPTPPTLPPEATMLGTRRRGLLRHIFGPYARPQFWKETLHLLLDLPIGVAIFIAAITGLVVSVSTLAVIIGIPLFALTVQFGKTVGVFERARARVLLDTPLHGPRPALTSGTWWDWAKAAFTDRAGWMGLAYSALMVVWGPISFSLAVTAITVAAVFAGLPVYGWFLDNDGRSLWQITDTYVLSGAGRYATIAGLVLVGILSIAALPRIVHGLAMVDRGLIRGYLSGEEELMAERVTRLQQSRDASVSSANSELQRIERDLHDGAQQRLVSLAMNLGIAKDRLAREASASAGVSGLGDPGSVKALEMVSAAHDEAKQAIVELRDLVRGIHPAVLTDRGLDAAVSAVAARCPVPVTLHSDLERRLPPPVEATAYFVVAEALNNVAKHSQASSATVRLRERGDQLIVEVTDDGVGGAVEAGNGGLRGLRDRVLGVEGRLRLASPVGGPTTLIVEIPCES